MALITRLDDLPDLALIELFSYLSSTDILWGLTRLNHRLTMLITERGFFHHINLSLARYHQFNTILRFLPLNDIQSLSIDSDASPLQLTCWPYLPRLRTLRIIGVYNHDDLLIFILLHAATLTHLIIKSNERLVPDGHSIKFLHPLGDLMMLAHNILLIHLPALRSLDFGLHYYWMGWPITVSVPLTYLRLSLTYMDDLVRIMSTQQLSYTLRQLHVKISDADYYEKYPTMSTFHPLIPMVNIHTFTFFQSFSSQLTIRWAFIEVLTSPNVMPVLRRANMAVFVNIYDIYRISSSSIFTDHRHVDVHFAFNFTNCSGYMAMTQCIPRGHRFYPREIVGAAFLVSHCSERSEWIINGDPFSRGREYFHHIWYTLPWSFDEFFHEYLPTKWITQIQIFQIPSHTITTINQSSLRILDASGENLASAIESLPHVALSDCIETLHLSFYNRPIHTYLSGLRHITLVNSINCLNHCFPLPATVRSIGIHLLYYSPNYMLPDWSAVLYSLSTVSQLNSLRVFMYDLPKAIDNKNCQIIAETAFMVTDFGLFFRSRSGADRYQLETVFKDHTKFIKQLCDCILLLSFDKPPYYSIENDGCGLTMWF